MEGAVIKLFSVFGMMGLLFLTGCASSAYKARLDSREKQAASSGLYCEWIDGDKHSDIDVEINLAMARRCDSSKTFTLTPYKNSSDANGIMYCCAMRDGESKVSSSKKSSSPSTSAKATADGASAAASATSATKSATPAAKDSSPAGSDDIVEDK
jgi:hypothetical protein